MTLDCLACILSTVLVVCLLLRFEVALSGAYFQARSCVLAESRLDSKCKDLVVSPACVNVTNQVQLVVTPSENTTKPILLGLLIYEGSLAARGELQIHHGKYRDYLDTKSKMW